MEVSMKKDKKEKEFKPIRASKVFTLRLSEQQYEKLKKAAREAGHGIIARVITEKLFG
jgi:hypothetical protein